MMKQEDKILKARAQFAARKVSASEEASDSNLVLVEFFLFPEKYAVETSFVKEVITLKEITPIPGVPEFVMGVINFRGEIISVLNLKTLFGLKEKGLTEMNKVLILRNDKMSFGLVADAITGSICVPVSQFSEPPLTLSKSAAEFVRGLAYDGTIVLDGEQLLTTEILTVNQ